MKDVPVFDKLLHKERNSKQLKDLTDKAEKIEALKNTFSVTDEIKGTGRWNALIVDDLFDTGASLEVACTTLRGYSKIGKIYTAVLT